MPEPVIAELVTPRTDSPKAPKLRLFGTFRLATLFIVVTGCGICSCTALSFRAKVAHNISRQDTWLKLPNDASNISHFRPGTLGPITYYEFDTSEKSFVEWASKKRRVKPIPAAAPFRIRRYPAYGPDADERSTVMIPNGLLYQWTEEDRGSHYAYDRDSGRAYCWSHTR